MEAKTFLPPPSLEQGVRSALCDCYEFSRDVVLSEAEESGAPEAVVEHVYHEIMGAVALHLGLQYDDGGEGMMAYRRYLHAVSGDEDTGEDV